MISMEPRITTLITGPQLFETVQFIVRYWKCSFCKVWLYIRPFVRPLWDFRVHWKRNSDFYRRLWEWKAFLGLEYIGSIGIKDDGSIVSIHFFKNMCRVNKRFFFPHHSSRPWICWCCMHFAGRRSQWFHCPHGGGTKSWLGYITCNRKATDKWPLYPGDPRWMLYV